jgi:hypothetical protein
MDTNSALSPQQARSGPNRKGSRKPSTRTRIQKLVPRHGDGEHLLGLRFPLGKDGVVHGRPDPPRLVDLNLHETYNSNRISKDGRSSSTRSKLGETRARKLTRSRDTSSARKRPCAQIRADENTDNPATAKTVRKAGGR